MSWHRAVLGELGMTGRDGRLSHTKSILWAVVAIKAYEGNLSLGIAALVVAASHGLKGVALVTPYLGLIAKLPFFARPPTEPDGAT